MLKQLIFLLVLILTLVVFTWTVRRLLFFLSLTKPYSIRNFGQRLRLLFTVAFFQSKIFRRPVIGLMHALVFWGFCIITIGSLEMIIDGLSGKERIFSNAGFLYKFFVCSGDLFALMVLISIVAFLIRRLFMHIRRFEGSEMNIKTKIDAIIALSIIFLLMVSLLGINTFYFSLHPGLLKGAFPVSSLLAPLISPLSIESKTIFHEISWWMHILLIFLFANILPYSKHFHVFLSVPNVFLSRLEVLGKLTTMDSITTEIKLMMNPETAFAETPANIAPPERFGVKDVTDANWKTYLDSLSCTQCGRCTSVCPASITGKKLSPRKLFMDFRARMNEKGSSALKNGKDFDDQRSLLHNYVSEEELWACTTCNACAQECPVNINHPSLIVDMRRYLVLEEGMAPAEIKSMFTCTENNGAPWQYSPEDRLLWAGELDFDIPVVADTVAEGKEIEYLFWVGCAGAFDDRYKKVIRAIAKILHQLNINYAVLGTEETCTGDPARRAGNEMLYQVQALTNIETFNKYHIRKIVTACPHCFNILKNEYPDLGGIYEVVHHTQFLDNLMSEGILHLSPEVFKNKTITYHDPCYLGRANHEYQASRHILHALNGPFTEMHNNKSYALCCGAGGAQMFKEAEKGNREIFIERMDDALNTGAEIITTACPFCMTMLTDGIKYKNKEEEIKNWDLAELVVQAMNI